MTRRVVIDPSVVPVEPGALSFLVRINPGPPVVTFGAAPAGLKGAKWADVYDWDVILWFDCAVYRSKSELKTEGPQPWQVRSLLEHLDRFPDFWVRVVS